VANIKRGEREFTVGEGADARTFKMVMDINAFCELEGELGVSLPKLMQMMEQEPGMRVIRAIMYGCLYEHHHLTVQEAGTLISDMGMPAALQEITALTKEVMPVPGEGQPSAGNRQQRRAASSTKSKAGSTS
jgi:hypothetical protein